MKKKKTFLLLEILIAILIISICLVPLIQTPMQSYRAEIRILEEMEGERLADWTFSEIKEKLFKNEISWEKLPKPGAKAGPFSLSATFIQIPGCASKKIARSFTLKCWKKERERRKGEIYHMLRVEIDFQPRLSFNKGYTYHILVRQLPRNEKPASK